VTPDELATVFPVGPVMLKAGLVVSLVSVRLAVEVFDAVSVMLAVSVCSPSFKPVVSIVVEKVPELQVALPTDVEFIVKLTGLPFTMD
jgi:hypothetical protein